MIPAQNYAISMLNAGGSGGLTTPAFSLNMGDINQSIVNGFNALAWSVVEFDTNNDIVGNLFVPNTAGKYLLNLKVGTESASTFALCLYKNGARFKDFYDDGYSNVQNQAGTMLVDAIISDYFEAYIYSFGGGHTVRGTTNSSYFQGHLVAT